MSVLELVDGDAAKWFASHTPDQSRELFRSRSTRDRRRRHQLHLLLGDSIARRSGLSSRFRGDAFLDRARGGETWSSLFSNLDHDIAAWQLAATSMGLTTGTAVIWLTGNDVYSRLSLIASFNNDSLTAVEATAKALVRRLRPHAEGVLVLGPLPRLAGEVCGTTWEATAAYHLERTLVKADLGQFARVTPLGEP